MGRFVPLSHMHSLDVLLCSVLLLPGHFFQVGKQVQRSKQINNFKIQVWASAPLAPPPLWTWIKHMTAGWNLIWQVYTFHMYQDLAVLQCSM